MAYVTTNPPVVFISAIGGHPTLWIYKSADAHAAVDAAGYFTDGANLGMKADDAMIVVDTGGNCTIHHVLNATTISAGTFS